LTENPTVFYHLGLAHWKNGDEEEAVKTLNKALKMNRDFPEKEEAEKLLEEIRSART